MNKYFTSLDTQILGKLLFQCVTMLVLKRLKSFYNKKGAHIDAFLPQSLANYVSMPRIAYPDVRLSPLRRFYRLIGLCLICLKST